MGQVLNWDFPVQIDQVGLQMASFKGRIVKFPILVGFDLQPLAESFLINGIVSYDHKV